MINFVSITTYLLDSTWSFQILKMVIQSPNAFWRFLNTGCQSNPRFEIYTYVSLIWN